MLHYVYCDKTPYISAGKSLDWAVMEEMIQNILGQQEIEKKEWLAIGNKNCQNNYIKRNCYMMDYFGTKSTKAAPEPFFFLLLSCFFLYQRKNTRRT